MKPYSKRPSLSCSMLILLPWLLLLPDARGGVSTYSTNFLTTGGTVMLPRFDPSAGSLFEATLTVRALFVGGYTFYNSYDEPMQIGLPITALASFSIPEVGWSGGSGGSGFMSGTVPPHSSAYIPANVYGDWTPQAIISSEFCTGTDPFALHIMGTATASGLAYLSGNFYCEATLTYASVVPEPSTVTLLTFALSAVALVARRKHQGYIKR